MYRVACTRLKTDRPSADWNSFHSPKSKFREQGGRQSTSWITASSGPKKLTLWKKLNRDDFQNRVHKFEAIIQLTIYHTRCVISRMDPSTLKPRRPRGLEIHGEKALLASLQFKCSQADSEVLSGEDAIRALGARSWWREWRVFGFW